MGVRTQQCLVLVLIAISLAGSRSQPAAAAAQVAEPGGSCGPTINTVCSGNQCCSSADYCGVTEAHCVGTPGSNCQPGWGKCGQGFVVGAGTPTGSTTNASPGTNTPGGTTAGPAGITTAAPLTAAPGGSCGPSINTQCSGSQCCSAAGYCGISREHCVGSGCQQGWGKCGPEYAPESNARVADLPEEPNKDTTLAAAGGPCGPSNNAMCPGSQCCSVHGFCGVTDEHCSLDKGCVKGWGTCQGTPPPIQPGKLNDMQLIDEPKRLNIGTIIGIVSSVLVGTAAVLGLLYNAWKWYHKHMALKKKSQSPIDALPRLKDISNMSSMKEHTCSNTSQQDGASKQSACSVVVQ